MFCLMFNKAQIINVVLPSRAMLSSSMSLLMRELAFSMVQTATSSDLKPPAAEVLPMYPSTRTPASSNTLYKVRGKWWYIYTMAHPQTQHNIYNNVDVFLCSLHLKVVHLLFGHRDKRQNKESFSFSLQHTLQHQQLRHQSFSSTGGGWKRWSTELKTTERWPSLWHTCLRETCSFLPEYTRLPPCSTCPTVRHWACHSNMWVTLCLW